MTSNRSSSVGLLLMLAFGMGQAWSAEPESAVRGLRVPPGFEVNLFAEPDLAHDIYTLHIDAQGRIVVAGRGYVRELLPNSTETQATAARDLIPPPQDGPTGMLWEQDTLYLVHDGGLRKWKNVTGEKPAAGPSELLVKLKTGGEHDAHAVRRCPQGKLLVLCGNTAQIDKLTLAAESPIKKPIAGGLVQYDEQSRAVQVIADGFRNAYDFDFTLEGWPMTFDSDNERCIGLPWYEFTRCYHIRPGGNYGWLNPQHTQTWRKPPEFPDVVAPVCTLGRGSPTAVTCYRHSQFPKKYQGGLFLADWTFGKIWFVPLTRKGDTVTGTPELFLETTGETGFAPTGMAVHPKTGELFVSMGGRGTRGSVFRIRAKVGDNAKSLPIVAKPNPPVERFAPPISQEYHTMEQVRELQLRLGDIGASSAQGTYREGYTFRDDKLTHLAAEDEMRLLQSYPKAGAIVRREIARCLAGIGARTPEARILISANLTDQSDVRDDIHHLMVLSRLKSPATPSTRQAITNALFRLEGKYTQQKLGRDRHWNLRLRETVTALIEHDPHLATAILAHPKFGTAEQIWLLSVPGWEARTVARKILAHADKDPMFGWTPALVSRLSSLPVTDVRPAVTKLRQIPELRESVTILLAAEPHEEDRDLFARGLNSGSSSVVSASAKGLTQLTSISRLTDEELLTTFRSLQRFSDVKLDADVRRHLYTLLKSKTGKTFPEKDAIWIKWLEETQAELARKLRTTPGYDAQAWQARLKLVPRDKGNAERGKQLFVRAQCQACHNGGSAVGPSLEGVSKRFSRDDLLVAILDPSREIPARYRTTRIATREGKVFEGIIVYDAPDGILLQVSSEETVRIAGDSIEERTPGNRSLMPAGLLDDFKPEEIADLLAYLK